MPFQPVDGTAEFDFNMRLQGQYVQNSLYLYAPGLAWTAEDLGDAAQTLYDWYANDVMAQLSFDLTLVEVVGKYLGIENGPIGTYAPVTPAIGAGGDGSAPNNVTIALSFRTGLSGRSFRGRNYIPGLQDSSVSGNTVAPAVLTSLLTAYGILSVLAPGLTNPAQHVVVSRYANGALRPAGVTTPVLSYVFVDNTVDSQRRRLPGRGR